jgi:hypothetical protein
MRFNGLSFDRSVRFIRREKLGTSVLASIAINALPSRAP